MQVRLAADQPEADQMRQEVRKRRSYRHQHRRGEQHAVMPFDDLKHLRPSLRYLHQKTEVRSLAVVAQGSAENEYQQQSRLEQFDQVEQRPRQRPLADDAVHEFSFKLR